MGTCDVCGKKLKIINRFRYTDGYICKECYKKASRQFTETIIKKTLPEIQEICQSNNNMEQYPNFQITARIGLKGKNKTVDIVLISSGARIKSYAFRQSYHFAQRIEKSLNDMKLKSI